MLSCKFCLIFQNIFFYRTIILVVSGLKPPKAKLSNRESLNQPCPCCKNMCATIKIRWKSCRGTAMNQTSTVGGWRRLETSIFQWRNKFRRDDWFYKVLNHGILMSIKTKIYPLKALLSDSLIFGIRQCFTVTKAN